MRLVSLWLEYADRTGNHNKSIKNKNIQQLLYVGGHLAPTKLALAARRPSGRRFSPLSEGPNLTCKSRICELRQGKN